MIRKKLGLWAPILVLAAALVMFAVSTGEVDAARGGKPGGGGGKPGGGTTPTVTLTVSPDPVPAYSYATVTGTGFTPGAQINWVIDGGVVMWGSANANGVASVSFAVSFPGTVGVSAKQLNGSSWVVVGSIMFSVV